MVKKCVGLVVIAMVGVALGCGDDDGEVGSDAFEGEQDVGVFLEKLGDDGEGILYYEQWDEQYVRFCYADTGCEEGSSGSMGTNIGKAVIDASDPDKDVVGVIVEGELESDYPDHEGMIVIAVGETEENNIGPPDFEIEEEITSEGPFSDGDTVSFSLGETK